MVFLRAKAGKMMHRSWVHEYVAVVLRTSTWKNRDRDVLPL